MYENQENYFVQKSTELYFTTYLIKEFEKIQATYPDKIDEWLLKVNELYEVIQLLSPSEHRGYKVLENYLKEGIVDKIICEIDEPEIDKKTEKVFLKDTTNQDLFGLKFLDIGLYLRDFHDEKYIINIFISNINIQKLHMIINNYLEIWEQNLFQSSSSNFYKKDKQVEMLTHHIQGLLKNYDKKNLIIKMSNFNDGIQYEYVSECPIDILATILYLEKIGYLNFKEIRLGIESFYDLLFVVDIKDYTPIQENNLKLTFSNSLLSYNLSIKVFGKQKDLIEALFKNNGSVLENDAYKYIYGDFRNNDPIRSLIVNTNKKLDQVGYNHKIHKENGKIVLEME